MSHTSFFGVCINFDQFLVPMLQASGTYAVLLAWVCMYVCMCGCVLVLQPVT